MQPGLPVLLLCGELITNTGPPSHCICATTYLVHLRAIIEPSNYFHAQQHAALTLHMCIEHTLQLPSWCACRGAAQLPCKPRPLLLEIHTHCQKNVMVYIENLSFHWLTSGTLKEGNYRPGAER